MSVFIPNTASSRLNAAWTGAATQDLTIACWIWIPPVVTANYRVIVGISPNIELETATDGLTIDFGTTSADHNGPLLAVSTWYHIVMTIRNASTTSRQIKGYVNGKQVVDVADTTTFVAYTGLVVGNLQSLPTTHYFNGNIRDLRIWTRELNALNVQAEYLSPAPVNTEGLIVWSPFDDDIYTDRSGNGRVWTPTGSPVLQFGSIVARPAYVARRLPMFNK
jgi:hypothetical protein